MTYPYTIGMTLAGGGARGAYSAGVLRYLFREAPKHLGFVPWPNLVSGTSVGALNGYFAATHSRFEVLRMTQIWQNIRAGDIFNLPTSGAISTIRRVFATAKTGAFLDNSPLRALIIREAQRRTLRHSIAAGKCKAFIVSATHLTTGVNTLFVEAGDANFKLPPPPRGQVVYHKIYPKHLMASIAIPCVFHPEKIGGKHYVDGGVRQNTPLRPVLQGGAERIVVISTRTQKPFKQLEEPEPSFALIAGKALNALTLDPVERDASVANKINEIIEWGRVLYGDEFGEKIEAELGIRQTAILHFRPSVDLGRLAMETYNPKKIQGSSGTKWLFAKLYAAGEQSGESDLLSQLMFDRDYCMAAEQLGFKDASDRADEMLSFFNASE